MKIHALLFSGLLILSSCGSSSAMPDEFWGSGSWRFDSQEERLHDGASGVALMKLKFTRITGDQYEIFGDVTYVEDTMACDTAGGASRICPTDTCEYVSSTPGTIAGVAEVTNGILTLKPVWNGDDMPVETVNYICDAENGDGVHDTAAVRSTMDLYGAGFVNTVWTMDVNDTTFIDDLPPGEVTDIKTAYINFETEVGFVKAEGLFALYRNEPE